MKRIVLLVLMSLMMAGCARTCNNFSRKFSGVQNYHIRQYSGGVLIGEYRFKGVLDNQNNSDGFFFFKGDTLIELSGDLIIESHK